MISTVLLDVHTPPEKLIMAAVDRQPSEGGKVKVTCKAVKVIICYCFIPKIVDIIP